MEFATWRMWIVCRFWARAFTAGWERREKGKTPYFSAMWEKLKNANFIDSVCKKKWNNPKKIKMLGIYWNKSIKKKT